MNEVVSIMQPYFFPYLGYFQLMSASDRIILLDDVQYIRHGWVNRNRILKPGAGWQYIGVPLRKHSRGALIRDVRIDQDRAWKDLLLRQLDHYRVKAPFFAPVMQIVSNVLSTAEDSLVDLNRRALDAVSGYLELPCHIEIASDLNLDYTDVSGPGDWALRICEQLGAHTYVNPADGKALFSPGAFEDRSIELTFLRARLDPYPQKRPFESALSIIDVMMFNDQAAAKEMVKQYTLHSKEGPDELH